MTRDEVTSGRGALAGSTQAFEAVMRAVIARADVLDAEARSEALAIVEQALAEKPPAMTRQVRLFLRLLDWSAILRWGRPLHRLDPARVTRHLQSFERSPVPLLRKGMWGVRTLAFMAYYARPAGAASVGYRGAPGGWSARKAGT